MIGVLARLKLSLGMLPVSIRATLAEYLGRENPLELAALVRACLAVARVSDEAGVPGARKMQLVGEVLARAAVAHDVELTPLQLKTLSLLILRHGRSPA